MIDPALARKMFLKPEHRAGVMAMPDGLETLLAGVETATSGASEHGGFTWLLLFAQTADELKSHLEASAAMRTEDTLLWVAYPKGVDRARIPTDLKRDVVARVADSVGLRPVSQVSIDAVWSAMRLKPGSLNLT